MKPVQIWEGNRYTESCSGMWICKKRTHRKPTQHAQQCKIQRYIWQCGPTIFHHQDIPKDSADSRHFLLFRHKPTWASQFRTWLINIVRYRKYIYIQAFGHDSLLNCNYWGYRKGSVLSHLVAMSERYW